MPSNVLPLHLKETFLPIIWIINEGEGDGTESSLPFKIFSTLFQQKKNKKKQSVIIPTNIFDIPAALLVWSTKNLFCRFAQSIESILCWYTI